MLQLSDKDVNGNLEDSFEMVSTEDQLQPKLELEPGPMTSVTSVTNLTTQKTLTEIKKNMMDNKRRIEKLQMETAVKVKKDPLKSQGGFAGFRILIKNIPLDVSFKTFAMFFGRWGKCQMFDGGYDPESETQWLILSYTEENRQVIAALHGNGFDINGHKVHVKLLYNCDDYKAYINGSRSHEAGGIDLKVKETPMTMKKCKDSTKDQEKDVQVDLGLKKELKKSKFTMIKSEENDDQNDDELKDDIVGQLGWGWTLLLLVLCIVPWGRSLLFFFMIFGVFWRLRHGVKKFKKDRKKVK